MPSYKERPAPDETDIRNAYRLALAREAESEAVVADQVAHAGRNWLANFFRSGEFREGLRGRLIDPRAAGVERLMREPDREMIAWICHRLPISDATRDRIARATDGYGVLGALLGDETFRREILDEEAADTDLLAALEAKSAQVALGVILGEVEGVTQTEIRGWAVDERDPDRVLDVHLLIEGHFAAAGRTTMFRRDLQDRFGGRGERGFLLRYTTPAAIGAGTRGELREAASGTSLGSFRIPDRQRPSLDAVAAIRRELDSLRALIGQIEGKLPAFHAEMGFSIESYPDYWDAFYAPLERAAEAKDERAEITLIVDGIGARAGDLDLLLDSVVRQGAVPRALFVLHGGGEAAYAVEDMLRRLRARMPNLPVEALAGAAADRSQLLNEAVARCATETLLLVKADGLLAPMAVEEVTRSLAEGATLVFADDDRVEWTTGSTMRHSEPRLRSTFDRDLLLQTGSLGAMLGLRTEAARQVGFRPDHGEAVWFEFLLRLNEAAPEERLHQLPHVLFHHLSDHRPEVDQRIAAAADHLSRTEPGAMVETQSDILGARIEGALRVKRPLPEGVRAAIIIPTKDRLDLLGPCIASIAASQPKNRVRLDILVVDNRSTAPATRAFLDSYSRLADLRVIEHDAPFNWALINNRAAEFAPEADVLVFLNNDTVVLAPDCWDSLCANALRPDVGAVGARLLYEDGTIQHAGVVMDPWHSFASHEGVGLTGSDPGYCGRNALLRQISMVTGACMATRADVFRQSGGFDALNFPYEGNDTDYCLRLRAQGLKILYDPGAAFYHFESKSRGFNTDEEKRKRAFAATQTLRARWASRFEQDPYYNPHFDRLAPPFTKLQPPPLL